jgi:hypothetical protein
MFEDDSLDDETMEFMASLVNNMDRSIETFMETFMKDMNDSLDFLRSKEDSSVEEIVATTTIISTIERLNESMTMASETIHVMAMMLCLTSPTEQFEQFMLALQADKEYTEIINVIMGLVFHYKFGNGRGES